jgi:hypothetical protein
LPIFLHLPTDDSHFWLQTKIPKKTTTLIQRLVTSEANRPWSIDGLPLVL